MLKTVPGTDKTENRKKDVESISRQSAIDLSGLKGAEIYDLFTRANRIRDKFRGNKVDLCSIINAKSGACPEDCSFCAQSSRNKTEAGVYPLISKEKILEAATSVKKSGVGRFCIVTSGRQAVGRDLREICGSISEIRKTGLLPCATLGMLEKEQLEQLKMAGLHRYHHNLETSEAFFGEICTTHTYREKIRTIETAKALGFSICSGGIFGLGESWEDRIDLAFALKGLEVDSVPINFFTPISGTPLAYRDLLHPLEALKIISIYRLILPYSEIRVSGT
jgi:biotin synthase